MRSEEVELHARCRRRNAGERRGRRGRGGGKEERGAGRRAAGGGGGGGGGTGGGDAPEGKSGEDDLTNLSAAAAVGQPEAVRVNALVALHNLACAAENMVPMLQHDGVRAALVGGAAVGQPEAVRVQALGALCNLSCAAENRCRCG